MNTIHVVVSSRAQEQASGTPSSIIMHHHGCLAGWLTAVPTGARFPKRIWRCPEGLMGFSSGMMMSWPSSSPGTSFRFSATVLPVTV